MAIFSKTAVTSLLKVQQSVENISLNKTAKAVSSERKVMGRALGAQMFT
jgi:hypothetical protein